MRALATLLIALLLTGCTLVHSRTPCGSPDRPCYRAAPERSCDDLVLHVTPALMYWSTGCNDGAIQPEERAKLPLRTRLRMRWEEWRAR